MKKIPTKTLISIEKDISQIRKNILKLSYKKKEGHIGSSFSIVEILYIYWKYFTKNTKLILSKGHAAIGLYSVLFQVNKITKKDFYSFCDFNSKLGGHPDSNKLNLATFSTGSLGHGFPTSAGLAFAEKIKGSQKNIFCLMGDQELLEGTTWETLYFIQNNNINNLILLVDKNNSDYRSTKLLNIKDKFYTFTKNVYEVDGHSIVDLIGIFKKILKINKFTVVILNTIKGKGLKETENNPSWHHRIPSKNELLDFNKELDSYEK